MTTFILLAVVVAVVSAATGPSHSSDSTGGSHNAASYGDTGSNLRGDNSGYDSGNGGYGSGNDGYGSGNGGYGSGNDGSGNSYGNGGYDYNRGGYGNNHAGYGGRYYAPPPPPPQEADRIDKLDKLFLRVDAVIDQVKTESEQVVALEARQAVQTKFFDILVTETLEALANTDENQDDRLTELERFLTALENELDNGLEPAVESLATLNNANEDQFLENEQLLTQQIILDRKQAGRIARLVSVSEDFKDRLFKIKKNEFELFDDEVERTTQDLKASKAIAKAQTCEVGDVTLYDIEGTSELTFQTDFGDQPPQVFLGLKSFNFNTNAVEDEAKAQGGYGYSGGYGHNQGYKEPEPGSIGTRFNTYTTPKGIRFEFFFFGIGDTKIVTATLNYQACSIGPGIGRVNH